MEPAFSDDAARLLDAIAGARACVPFTGAGISTESGVPDFRSPDSPWLRNKPIDFADFLASETARREAWRRKFAMDDLYRDARPGRGHMALARLVARGSSPGVITQNIDNLHQESGLDTADVAELHGNGTYAACLECGRRHALGPIRLAFERGDALPLCEACDGILKSATISFGQSMPAGPMRHARELALAADLVVAIGSSLCVHPAAGFPLLAKRNGARLAILNREPTEFDALADIVVHGEIGPILEPLLRDP